MAEFKLCYVDQYKVLYFTDNFERQWGDDWDDAPYHCNASEPYAYVENYEHNDNSGHIRYMAFYPVTEVVTPAEIDYYNCHYSVKDINSGAVAWLYDRSSHSSIHGGATMEQVTEWFKRIGAKYGELK